MPFNARHTREQLVASRATKALCAGDCYAYSKHSFLDINTVTFSLLNKRKEIKQHLDPKSLFPKYILDQLKYIRDPVQNDVRCLHQLKTNLQISQNK